MRSNPEVVDQEEDPSNEGESAVDTHRDRPVRLNLRAHLNTPVCGSTAGDEPSGKDGYPPFPIDVGSRRDGLKAR